MSRVLSLRSSVDQSGLTSCRLGEQSNKAGVSIAKALLLSPMLSSNVCEVKAILDTHMAAKTKSVAIIDVVEVKPVKEPTGDVLLAAKEIGVLQ